MGVNPKKISIYIPYCFCEADFVNAIWNVFAKDVDRDKIVPVTPFMKNVISSYKKNFKNVDNVSNFSARRRLQELYWGKSNLESLNSDSLRIKEVIKD